MGQNREPRNKPTRIWPVHLQWRSPNIQWGINRLFNKWRWESSTGTCKWNETRQLPHIMLQNQLKMDWRLKGKTWNYKLPSGKQGQFILGHGSWQHLPRYVSSGKRIKNKNKIDELEQKNKDLRKENKKIKKELKTIDKDKKRIQKIFKSQKQK